MDRRDCIRLAAAAAAAAVAARLVPVSAAFAQSKYPQSTIRQIIKDPEFGRVMESAGLEARADASSAAAQAYLASERERLVPIIKAAGLQPV
jgi:tripartite-type tricarboxylate transporter receptor subunit TctC